MKYLKRRILSLIMCFLMLISIFHLTADAGETDNAGTDDIKYVSEETAGEIDCEGDNIPESQNPEPYFEDAESPEEEPVQSTEAADVQDEEPVQYAEAADVQDEEPVQYAETADAQDEEPVQYAETADAQDEEPVQYAEAADVQDEDPVHYPAEEEISSEDHIDTDQDPADNEDAGLEIAAVPGINSKVSAKNALAILKAYDSEGYYIVNYMMQNGDSIDFWLFGSSSNAQGLDTAVHEEFHSYTFTKGGYFKQAIYLGNGREILVNTSSSDVTIFPTSTWAETLPSNLRTFRFDTYVSRSSSTSANVSGPYGLLNEFAAYCWGMNNQLALFPYYKSQGNTMQVWGDFVTACGNDRQAYAEFRLWILGYLNYAKKNNSAVYKLFINDQDFCKAYIAIKEKFEKEIETFNARCDEIISLAAADGIRAYFDGNYFWFGNTGRSTNYTEYALLMNELSKSQYQNIEAALYAAGGGSSTDQNNGFVNDNGSWGWYKNGKLQTSMTGIIKGTINGKENWYYIQNGIFTKTTGFAQPADGSNKNWYFVSNGEIKTGWVKYNNKYYYFRPQTGTIKTGWVKSGGNYYYFSPSNGALRTGWLQYLGNYYYLSPTTGTPVTGTQIIDGETCIFDDTGVYIG